MKIYKSYYTHDTYYLCFNQIVYKLYDNHIDTTIFTENNLNYLPQITLEDDEYTHIENILLKNL